MERIVAMIFPSKFRPFICERHPDIFVQALKEEVNALEEAGECVIVRNNVPRCL